MRDVAATHEQGIGFAWAGRGAWDSALTVMGRLASAGGTDAGLNAYRLAVAGAWLGAANTAVAGLQRADAVRDVGADYHKRVDLAWLDGILAVARADAGGLVRAREQLAADTGLVAARLERSLAAFESEMRGDRDSAARLMLELVREVRDIGGWGSSHPMELPVHRLAASRWLVAKGDAAIADSLLRWHEGFYAFSGEEGWALNATMPIVLLERARLNAGLGRTDAARHFYEEFLRRFDMPDESLRHLVVEAERARGLTSCRPRVRRYREDVLEGRHETIHLLLGADRHAQMLEHRRERPSHRHAPLAELGADLFHVTAGVHHEEVGF